MPVQCHPDKLAGELETIRRWTEERNSQLILVDFETESLVHWRSGTIEQFLETGLKNSDLGQFWYFAFFVVLEDEILQGIEARLSEGVYANTPNEEKARRTIKLHEELLPRRDHISVMGVAWPCHGLVNVFQVEAEWVNQYREYRNLLKGYVAASQRNEWFDRRDQMVKETFQTRVERAKRLANDPRFQKCRNDDDRKLVAQSLFEELDETELNRIARTARSIQHLGN